MTVPFGQAIIAGDRGRDVRAVRRTLHRHMGFPHLPLTDTTGKRWEHAIRTVQHDHKLHVDGVYGRATHEVVAPHMDAYARWLYEHAAKRERSDYVNPFAAARIEVGRVDAGCDYHGYGPIHAIGDATIVGLSGYGDGWPGGHYLLYRLRSGRHASRYIYIAESIEPLVEPGQNVKAGQAVCNFGADAGFGLYPGIEFGWGSNVTNVTYADATGEPSGPARSDTASGRAFARFLKACGAPAPDTGRGPEFP